MRKHYKVLVALAAFIAAAGPILAASTEVRLRLPRRAQIDLAGRKSITVAPFLVVSQEESSSVRGRDIDVQKEFERYLLKVLRRETDLKIVEPGPIDYPTFDVDRLSRDRDFWVALGERTQADLILAGSLDFDIQDQTGYRTEEYVSPFDGRPYYRQVLVEQTGFSYDILMQVYDGDTGEQVFLDNFKDFQSFEGSDADPLVGMFENLNSIQDRISNIFAVRSVEASRILFTD